jgi:hypothetical protein
VGVLKEGEWLLHEQIVEASYPLAEIEEEEGFLQGPDSHFLLRRLHNSGP